MKVFVLLLASALVLISCKTEPAPPLQPASEAIRVSQTYVSSSFQTDDRMVQLQSIAPRLHDLFEAFAE